MHSFVRITLQENPEKVTLAKASLPFLHGISKRLSLLATENTLKSFIKHSKGSLPSKENKLYVCSLKISTHPRTFNISQGDYIVPHSLINWKLVPITCSQLNSSSSPHIRYSNCDKHTSQDMLNILKSEQKESVRS